MVDIHTHLLPDFDDGPSTIEETRLMLKTAEEGGTTELVITPHLLNILDYDRENEILEKYKLVQQLIKKDGRKLKAHLGGEIFIYPDTNLDRIFSTLNNNGKFALVEFSMRQIPEFAPQKFFDWLMAGYYPILAHPERYLSIIKNPKYAYKFAQMGVALQVNSGSLLGIFGESIKNVAHQLIEHNLAHIVASDGHNADSRTISLAQVLDHVKDKFGEETAELLLNENPRRAIRGEKLITKEPVPFDDWEGKTSRWQVLKKKLKLGK